jgi:hypothetical protein
MEKFSAVLTEGHFAECESLYYNAGKSDDSGASSATEAKNNSQEQ